MVQKKFDVSLIEKSVKANPNVKNKLLYELSNAITDNQKTIVRKKKAKLKKVQNPPEENSSGRKYTKINSVTIEAVLLEGANTGNTNLANLARCMIDFFVKIKGKTDEIEDDIDMEALKEIGINIKSGS